MPCRRTDDFSSSRYGRHYSDLRRNRGGKSAGQKTTIARKVFRKEVLDTAIGSSYSFASEEDIRGAAAAPILDAGVAYSYDALSGPGKGNDILGHAIEEALQRYENKLTEKLVKEYEFVDIGKDLGEDFAAAADDDFERVDHASIQ